MSSPLAQLGRTRRAPLPDGGLGKRRAPFKTGSSYTAQEEDLFSGRLTSPPNSLLLLPPGAHEARGKLGKPSRGPPAPSDGQLLSAMSARLAQLEQRVKVDALEIHDKNQKMKSLEEKIKSLQTMRAAERDAGATERGVAALRERCSQLQDQLEQMEKFLRDYGLVWVGEPGGHATAAADDPWEASASAGGGARGSSETTAAAAAAAVAFRVDFDAVLRHVRELNAVAGDGSSHVEVTARGARLRALRAVPLVLYRNGMVMFGGPFRPYSDPVTQECLQDIMDGYFPSELQQRYPDGVPFQVTDRRDVEFKERRAGEGFPGHGETLGGGAETSRLVRRPTSGSTEQFLGQLPTCVIKRGSVVPVREAVRSLLTNNDSATPSGGLITVQTNVDRAERECLASGSDGGGGGIATLRVRSESGERRYLLRMDASETIAHLRAHLDTHSARRGRSPRYELLSSFPPRVCDDSASLETLGLVPGGALIMRAAR